MLGSISVTSYEDLVSIAEKTTFTYIFTFIYNFWPPATKHLRRQKVGIYLYLYYT